MNNRVKLLFIICSLFIANYPSLFAWDFGLTFNQKFNVLGYGSDTDYRYSGGMVPSISGLFGENSDYYLSAGMEAAYLDSLGFIPELLRTELTFRFRALEIKAGRIYYSDPLDLIFSGIFDGARVSYESRFGNFYVGGWYTGMIYKKRLNIEMTAADQELTNAPLNTDEYWNSYYAPKRLLAGIGWEHLSLGGEPSGSVALLGQFDLSNGASPGGEATGGDSAVNSQYIVAKGILPVNDFSFSLGGGLQFVQKSGKFGTGFMAELVIDFAPKISQNSKLSFLARYASGKSGGLYAFLPVTIVNQGYILRPKLSGITMIQMDYMAPFHDTLSAGISSSYFIRNDLKTYSGYPLSGEDGSENAGSFLGNEFFLRLLWRPFSDISVNLGGGVFLPSLGDVAPKVDNIWRVELNVSLLLY
jgi:hypothetical protein